MSIDPQAPATPAPATGRLALLAGDLHVARERVVHEPRQLRWHVACIAVAGVGTLLLLLGAGYHGGFAAMHALHRLLPDALWQNITYLGDTAVALFVLLLIARRQPVAWWSGIIAALLGAVMVNGLKNLVGALRPPAVLDAELLTVVGRIYRNGSFPSGHAVTAFALALTLLPLCRGVLSRATLLLAATIVAASRVAVGVHWPVDILAGAALGAALSWLSWQLAWRWRFGVTWAGHLTLLGLLVVATLLAWIDAPDYPAARPLHLLLGMFAFAAAIAQYLWPRFLARGS